MCCTECYRSFLFSNLLFVVVLCEVEVCDDTLLYRFPIVDFDSFAATGRVLLLETFDFIVNYTYAGMRLLLCSVTILVNCVRTGIVPNKMELTSACTSGPQPAPLIIILCACYWAVPAAYTANVRLNE